MLTQAIPVVANVLCLAGIGIVQGGHDWLYEASEVLLTLLLLRTLKAIGWVEAVAFALQIVLQGSIIFWPNVEGPILHQIPNALVTSFNPPASDII